MKCSVMVCPNSLEEYGSYDFNGTKVCEICYMTFNWIEKSDYELGSL